MSNFIDFLLVISKLQSPIYCRSPQEESSAPRRKTLSLPRERTVQALALAGTASAVGRLVVNVLTIVSTMKYEIQRWNFLEFESGVFPGQRGTKTPVCDKLP